MSEHSVKITYFKMVVRLGSMNVPQICNGKISLLSWVQVEILVGGARGHRITPKKKLRFIVWGTQMSTEMLMEIKLSSTLNHCSISSFLPPDRDTGPHKDSSTRPHTFSHRDSMKKMEKKVMKTLISMEAEKIWGAKYWK